MDAESLGGTSALQEAAQHLSTLVFGASGVSLIVIKNTSNVNWMQKVYIKLKLFFAEISEDAEFLEAVISALRSLLQMIASKNIPQVRTLRCYFIYDFMVLEWVLGYNN